MPHEKFDKELALKWIAMLREPDRRQAEAWLVRLNVDTKETSQCCLGVACEAAGMEETPLAGGGWSRGYRRLTEKGKGRVYLTGLPTWLRMKLGLSTNDEAILVNMNDVHKKSFRSIANWLENTYIEKGLISIDDKISA